MGCLQRPIANDGWHVQVWPTLLECRGEQTGGGGGTRGPALGGSHTTSVPAGVLGWPGSPVCWSWKFNQAFSSSKPLLRLDHQRRGTWLMHIKSCQVQPGWQVSSCFGSFANHQQQSRNMWLAVYDTKDGRILRGIQESASILQPQVIPSQDEKGDINDIYEILAWSPASDGLLFGMDQRYHILRLESEHLKVIATLLQPTICKQLGDTILHKAAVPEVGWMPGGVAIV